MHVHYSVFLCKTEVPDCATGASHFITMVHACLLSTGSCEGDVWGLTSSKNIYWTVIVEETYKELQVGFVVGEGLDGWID